MELREAISRIVDATDTELAKLMDSDMERQLKLLRKRIKLQAERIMEIKINDHRFVISRILPEQVAYNKIESIPRIDYRERLPTALHLLFIRREEKEAFTGSYYTENEEIVNMSTGEVSKITDRNVPHNIMFIMPWENKFDCGKLNNRKEDKQ